MWTMIKNAPSKAKALFLVSLIYVMVGVSYYATADELKPNQPSYQAYRAQFSMFHSLRPWGMLFIVAGLVGMFFACKRGKFYYYGFFSLMLMSVWWAGLFTASLSLTGYTRVVPSILIWIMISVFLYIISAWPEMYTEAELSRELNRLEGELES